MMADLPRARAFQQADLEGCLAVFDSNVPGFFLHEERPIFRDFLCELPGPYLVLEDREGRIVGCGGYALRAAEGAADLCWGMVLNDCHRQGLGRILTERRIEAARGDPAISYIRLETSQHTTAFYERFGFVVESIDKDGYGGGLDRCEMRLVLAENPER